MEFGFLSDLTSALEKARDDIFVGTVSGFEREEIADWTIVLSNEEVVQLYYIYHSMDFKNEHKNECHITFNNKERYNLLNKDGNVELDWIEQICRVHFNKEEIK